MRFAISFIGIVCVGLGLVFIGILGIDNTKGAIEDTVFDKIQEGKTAITEIRMEQCASRYLRNSQCEVKFSKEVCANEILKACDSASPSYHGQVPSVSENQ